MNNRLQGLQSDNIQSNIPYIPLDAYEDQMQRDSFQCQVFLLIKLAIDVALAA